MIAMVVLTIIGMASTEIIDYTRENYVLIENGNAAIYEDYGDIFHITNLTYYKSLIQDTQNILNKKTKYTDVVVNDDVDIIHVNMSDDLEIGLIESLLKQLQITNHREKRGINELGILWKWLAGSPDHDDLVLITNKLSELAENNNKQFTTNSDIFEAINQLRKSVQNLEGNSHARMTMRMNKLIITELQNMIQTITLAKVGILNPAILNLQDIQEITDHEHESLTLTDLMDVSKFKIIQDKDVIIIYIKYPIIKKNCKLYETRAISQEDGKLLIDKEIVKCNAIYLNVKNCKLELRNTFCKLSLKESCLSKMLNNQKGQCVKVKENNKNLEIVKEGAILVSGNHTVDSHLLKGTYLITFDNKTIIDNVTYENPSAIIWNYLRTSSPNKYEIIKYLESEDDELKFKNVNLINSMKDQIEGRPLLWSASCLVITMFIIFALYKIGKVFQMCKLKHKNRTDEVFFDNINKNIQLLTKEFEETGRFS